MEPTIDRSCYLLTVAVLLLFVFLPVPSSGGEIYKWVDEEGTVHMTDNAANIPPKYRDQLVKKTLHTTTVSEGEPESQKSATSENAGRAISNRKRFELPFRAYEGAARRIIIPVNLNESVTAHLLLDTGAPGLVITPKLASRLGLLNEQDGNLIISAGGIGGTVPAMLAVVDTVSVGEARGEFLPATIAKFPRMILRDWWGWISWPTTKISIDNNDVIAFDELPPQIDRPGGHNEIWWRSHFQNFSNLRDEWNAYLKELFDGRESDIERDGPDFKNCQKPEQ